MAIRAVYSAWFIVTRLISRVWNTITGRIKTAYDNDHRPDIRERRVLGQAIGATKTAWDTLVGVIGAIWETGVRNIKIAYDTLLAPIFGPDGLLVKGVAAVVEPVKDAVNAVIRAINAILRAWNSIRFRVPTITVPFVGTFGGQSVGVVRVDYLPELAHGGNIMRGGAALVGERGPELVNLPRGAQVSPLDGSGGGVNINFYGPVYGVDDFNEKVNEARLAWERAGNG